MKSNQIISFFILFLIFSISNAQPVIGFWKVKNVQVGEFELTPMAKWTKINSDGTYQSGNGWLQNMEGKWTFDSKIMKYLPISSFGIKDEFGAFSVSFKNNSMKWQREENGDTVVVLLEKITKLPKSPADQIKGLWELKEVVKPDELDTSTVDSEEIRYIFLKWDRRYWARKFNSKQRFGYWHVNGHKPELTLIDDEKGRPKERWNILVTNNELTMVGISDSNMNIIKKYKSISEFPE